MSDVVRATFSDGVFRPDEAVNLPQNSRVRLVVEPLRETGPEDGLSELWREFDALQAEFPIRSVGPMPKRDQLHERD